MIIDKFNLLHIITILFYPVMGVVCYFIFKKASSKKKEIFLWIIMGIAFVATWLTFFTALITEESQRLNFWARLPLQMCSINVILYPLFYGLRKKVNPLIASTLFSYMYFVGSPGALLAMVVTSPADCLGPTINFLTYNVFTYWLKHGLIFVIPILMVTLGEYKPKLKDVLKATVFLIGLITIMEGVNLLFSWFGKLNGANEISNFFYTRTGAGTAVLSTFWNLIPIELVYMFPMIIIAIPIFAIYYLPIVLARFISKKLDKKEAQEA